MNRLLIKFTDDCVTLQQEVGESPVITFVTVKYAEVEQRNCCDPNAVFQKSSKVLKTHDTSTKKDVVITSSD